ncbi:hypothetical protein [Leifsonia poae]|uniref:hypothetical protein n=1 Tax=Leifsonia poae TaxID=110933 RepID=UPI001CBC11AD|nr:hypothetical protein [Leifsonia poae]
MDVEELLARAWGAVEKAGIPEPLQEYAFKEALSRLARDDSGGSSGLNESPGGSKGKQLSGEPSREISSTDEELFAKFSAECGIAVTDLERVYYFSSGEPHLNGPRSKLGKTSSEQAKAVALALTAAYDYALDKQVADEVVRAEAVRLKCDLGGTWARTMNGLSAISWVGANRQKQFKAKADTADALKKLVAAILGLPAE